MSQVKINRKDIEAVGEFVGIFAGDGNFYLDRGYRYQIRISINSDDSAYVNHVSSLIAGLVGKGPWTNTRTKENVTVLRLLSKEVYLFIRNYLEWQ